jgi:hypothetical protein
MQVLTELDLTLHPEDEPLHCQFHGIPIGEPADVCHVSPPRIMNESPGCGATELHVALQPAMPGACCHGVVFAVPLLESEPLAAM